jgi:hypothetical protein
LGKDRAAPQQFSHRGDITEPVTNGQAEWQWARWLLDLV